MFTPCQENTHKLDLIKETPQPAGCQTGRVPGILTGVGGSGGQGSGQEVFGQ